MHTPSRPAKPSASVLDRLDEETAIGDRALQPHRILVTGTLAIDYVCDYPGAFSTLPRHRGINLSVQLDRIERRFGGCAMNIAYTLRLLGDQPTPFVFVGQDFEHAPAASGGAFGDYAAHLSAIGMDTSGIMATDAPYSSHCFIFTDREQNQFTGFFGGAATTEFEQRLRRFVAERRFDYAILAPDLPAKMIAAARVMRELEVPFLTDPGQNITDFEEEDAARLVRASTALIVNQFEYDTIRGAAGDAIDDLDLLVVTLGAAGARWRSRGCEGKECAVKVDVVDPTGCGDAFRAGFVYATLREAPLRDAVRGGAVAASLVLETAGTQRHRGDEFQSRYRAAWGDSPHWLQDAGATLASAGVHG